MLQDDVGDDCYALEDAEVERWAREQTESEPPQRLHHFWVRRIAKLIRKHNGIAAVLAKQVRELSEENDMLADRCYRLNYELAKLREAAEKGDAE